MSTRADRGTVFTGPGTRIDELVPGLASKGTSAQSKRSHGYIIWCVDDRDDVPHEPQRADSSSGASTTVTTCHMNHSALIGGL
jgi:hypothetical protein